MPTITIPQNDGGFNLQFSVTDATDAAFDLTGYANVTLKVWDPGVPGTLLLNGTCVITGTTGGVVTYAVGTANFSTVGRYHAELELAKSTSGTQRESTENFRLTIVESG